MSTIRNLTVEKNLEAPTEPLALIALRLADGELLGTVDIWLDVATDVNVTPALPAYLRELADRLDARLES